MPLVITGDAVVSRRAIIFNGVYMFKVGDRVRCVDNKGWNTKFDLNKLYVITKADPMSNLIIVDNGEACYMSKSIRFKLERRIKNLPKEEV